MKPYIFLTQGFDSPPASNIFKIFFLVQKFFSISHPACEGAGGVFSTALGAEERLPPVRQRPPP